jgi:hypothetical protein
MTVERHRYTSLLDKKRKGIHIVSGVVHRVFLLARLIFAVAHDCTFRQSNLLG